MKTDNSEEIFKKSQLCFPTLYSIFFVFFQYRYLQKKFYALQWKSSLRYQFFYSRGILLVLQRESVVIKQK